MRRLVAHIREFRPEIMVTHDAYGGLTGHPDHLHTHRITMLAWHAAGLEELYPEEGAPWHPRVRYLATHPHSVEPKIRDIIGTRRTVYSVPDEQVTTTADVTPWLDVKVAAILAHRTEVERGALPGLIAGLSPESRAALLSTEWYIQHSSSPRPPQRQPNTP